MTEDPYEQDELHFECADASSFDRDAIAARIADLGYSFQDEADPTMFVVASDANSRDTYRERRRQDPSRGFPHVLLIRVEPGEVTVYQSATAKFLDYSREFVPWLVSHYPCRVTNEFGTRFEFE